MSAAPAVIAGCGESPYTRHPPPGTTTAQVLADAGARALASAGMEPAELDGLAVSSFSLAPDHAVDLAWRLGLRLRWLMQDTNGGASGINMLQHAARAVQAGDARAILVLAGDHLPRERFQDLVDNYNQATSEYLAPLPFGGPNSLFAMLTQRHAAAHGLTRSDYGALVVAQRAWAGGNPGAAYRDPMRLDDYLNAPVVAEPLCVYDCVPVVTGADAVIVCAADEPPQNKAIAIRALALSVNPDDQQGDGLRTGLADVSDQLWREAGTGPDEIDVTMVYDDYPAMALVQLADLGYAGDGDVRSLIHDQIATRKTAVNTSGGQLSAGQAGAAGGLHGVVEAAYQLRGEAGERQVSGARKALVAGYGMVCYRYGACAGAAILEAT
ncbi:MAG TPA: thiolase family protein [Solirubrobacteraceae bacterium]|nr:thiolase family protein [Solirubrobacteraceae bacterium]